MHNTETEQKIEKIETELSMLKESFDGWLKNIKSTISRNNADLSTIQSSLREVYVETLKIKSYIAAAHPLMKRFSERLIEEHKSKEVEHERENQ